MRDVRSGVWHWQARHPEWEAPWDANVSPAERDTAIVLTAPWRERDSQGLVERPGVRVYRRRPNTAEDLLRQFTFTAPEGWISSDVRRRVESVGEATVSE